MTGQCFQRAGHAADILAQLLQAKAVAIHFMHPTSRRRALRGEQQRGGQFGRVGIAQQLGLPTAQTGKGKVDRVPAGDQDHMGTVPRRLRLNPGQQVGQSGRRGRAEEQQRIAPDLGFQPGGSIGKRADTQQAHPCRLGHGRQFLHIEPIRHDQKIGLRPGMTCRRGGLSVGKIFHDDAPVPSSFRWNTARTERIIRIKRQYEQERGFCGRFGVDPDRIGAGMKEIS